MGSALACVEGDPIWDEKMAHHFLWEHKELMHAFLFWKLMTAAARRLVSGLALAGLPREAPARPIRAWHFLFPNSVGALPPYFRTDHFFALCYKG